MADDLIREFPCPECGQILRYPEGSVGDRTECPHCYAIVAVPPREAFVESSQSPEAKIIEYSPISTRQYDPNAKSTGIALGCLCLFLLSLFPLVLVGKGVLDWVKFLSPGFSLTTQNAPGILPFRGTILILWATHGIYTGMRLLQLRPQSPAIGRVFAVTSPLYWLVIIVLSAFNWSAEWNRDAFATLVLVWLLIVVPSVGFWLYFRYSEHLRKMTSR